MQKFALITIPLNIKDGIFTYSIPEKLQNKSRPGMRAIVPFRKKTMTGIIVKTTNQSSIKRTKSIIDIPDDAPLFSNELIQLNRWIADRFFCSPGEVFNAAMPVGSKITSKKVIKVKNLQQKKLKPFFKKIIETIENKKYGITRAELEKQIDEGDLSEYLQELEQNDIIQYDYHIKRKVKPKFNEYLTLSKSAKKLTETLKKELEQLSSQAYKQRELIQFLLNGKPDKLHELAEIRKQFGYGVAKRLKKKGLVEFIKKETFRDIEEGWIIDDTDEFEHTEDQLKAIAEIGASLNKELPTTMLLHGVTGSGKTEVYIRAAQIATQQNKGVIILVPEISLIPQLWGKFRKEFGHNIGILHSKLSAGERFDFWRRIKNGEFPIVMGARSAIFAPVKNLGLIILDEEFSSNYKQEEPPPYYDAREVARKRAELTNSTLILGTATPSIESYFNAMSGACKLLRLPNRVPGSLLPKVEIVDMQKEREIKKNYGSFSERLIEAIGERLMADEKVILLLNRRGYSSYIQCPDCGFVEKCQNCNVALTYHWVDNKLKCHYCGYEKNPGDTCAQCNAPQVKFKGRGTQRIEDELKQWYDKNKIMRLDTDSTRNQRSLFKILNKFNQTKNSILIGTQMIAKGLDFPDVTLVGVVNADIGLSLPDFRASERIFQLLMQVEGRAGRGMKPGKVLIQTYRPDDHSIKCAVEHDYLKFYNNEIIERRELNYPPFSEIILVRAESEDRETLATQLSNFKNELAINFIGEKGVEILGPAPAPLERLRNRWRWNILVKTTNTQPILDTITHLLRKSWKGIRIAVNVNPRTIL